MHKSMKERYRATLIGSAIGDTLGMPVEGWKREQIAKYVPGGIREPIEPVILRDASDKLIESDEFGKLKYYTIDLKKGFWTDDTILTTALAESIVREGDIDLDDIAKRQLNEYIIRLHGDKVIGGFGRTTMEAFNRLQCGISPLESGVIGGPGNGPAMKMSPLGLFMHATDSYESGLSDAERIGKITHLDPRSVVSGVLQSHAVYSLLEDVSKESFLFSLKSLAENYEKPLAEEFNRRDAGDLKSKILWIYENRNASDEDALKFLKNDSLVMRSHPFALFMFQKYWHTPLNGLLKTVNAGGDCDTTGAIYGALAGAKNGLFFPESWYDLLQDNERIMAAADGIYNLGKHLNPQWEGK
ncbi:MAG: ADP-ribosylglycohydrolase family protein [archaeon]